MNKKQSLLLKLGYFSIFASILSGISSLVATPDLIARLFSPDGALEAQTVEKITQLRIFLGCLSVTLFIVGFILLFLSKNRWALQLLKRLVVKLNNTFKPIFEKTWKFIPLWMIPLFLGLITFLTVNIKVTSDMAAYLVSAQNIFQGFGYLDWTKNIITSRPPGFPLLISGAFSVFGVSVSSGFWVVRILAVA